MTCPHQYPQTQFHSYNSSHVPVGTHKPSSHMYQVSSSVYVKEPVLGRRVFITRSLITQIGVPLIDANKTKQNVYWTVVYCQRSGAPLNGGPLADVI